MGGQGAGPQTKRAFYVRTLVVEEDALGNVVRDEYGIVSTYKTAEAAEQWLGEILTTLLTVGGTVAIRSDRVKVGQVGDEPLAQTFGLVAEWTPQAGKLRELAAPNPQPTAEPDIEDEPDIEPAEEE